MSKSDTIFTGSIADAHDKYLVPLIFEPYALDLVERADALEPDTMLEVAAGSGVVTRAVAPVLRAGVHYVATDLNKPMLDRAASRQPNPARSNGSRLMRSTCRFLMRRSTSFCVSSADVFSGSSQGVLGGTPCSPTRWAVHLQHVKPD